MAVMQMQRISICGLKKNRKAILEKIQSLGVIEVSQILDDDEDGFEKMDTAGSRMGFEKQAQLADQALAVLDAYVPEKKSMFASLEGKKQVDKDTFDAAVAQKQVVMDEAQLLVTANKQIAEYHAEIQKLQNQIDALTPWLALDVPMNYDGTANTSMLLGTMPPETTVEDIYTMVGAHNSELDKFDVEIISGDRDAVYLIVLCLKWQAAEIEEALRAGGFARPSQIVGQVPAQEKADREADIQKLEKEIGNTEEQIKKLAGKRDELELVGDYFRIRAKKYEVLGTIPQTESTFLISGYIPEDAVPVIQKEIGGVYDCVVDVEDVPVDEDPPVVLKNNSFSSSWEGIVASYGLPKKTEIDPTTIMSFFYVFFFGMMLSDAGYGILITVACFAALKIWPHMSRSMHQSLKMFMFCGVSTTVWGLLFGGFFGDLVEVVGATFFGASVKFPVLWFEPLNDPMRLLVYSMAFGLIHLFVGLGLKGYMELKAGQVKDFFCDVVLWYCFLIGLLLMLIPSDIFAGILQAKVTFPGWLNTLAIVLAAGGALGLLLMSGRTHKNPAVRLAYGAYDIYNITGWLSDVLSYSRLLALGLATSVIASVVNQMGSMFGAGIVGAIGFIVVFLIGHALNLAINMLGAYVHTNRLQYVEFFQKFYEGGGKPFEPFESDTKYVDIKEETLS